MKKLFESYKNYFRFGAAISGFLLLTEEERKKFNLPAFDLPEKALAASQFNLVVAENECKMESVYVAENSFDFSGPDRLLNFAKQNNQQMRWHTLVWHNQTPEWIFKDEKGQRVSKEVLEERLKNYIFVVGERYKNDICSVDVVNECISDKNFVLRNGEDRSLWFDILGEEYIDKAFFWAKQAFPKSSFVINDYNLEMVEGKRLGMYELLKGMKARGVPVDTVGLQMHINIENPPVSEIEKTIELYGSLGLNVIVTEMEISVYTDKEQGNNKFDALREFTPELFEQQAKRYFEIFECFKRQAKKGILKDVVLWGISDRLSWKNYFPVEGRNDAPLLFDREGKPKPAFERLTK